MYEPWDAHIESQEEGVKSQVVIWKESESSAVALNIPGALVISIAGNLEHRHFVEVCSFAGRRWRAAQERLILDFTRMKGAEGAGVRYVATQLHATANQSGGNVFFVRIPPTAKAYLDKTWGSEHIHFVGSLQRAIAIPTPAPSNAPFTPNPQSPSSSKKKKLQRKRRRTGPLKITRDFSYVNRRGRR